MSSWLNRGKGFKRRSEYAPLQRTRFVARRTRRTAFISKRVAPHSRRWYVAELDRVCSLIVRKRANYICELCGSTEDLTASHFYSRRWLRVRFDLRNLACHCFPCNTRHSVSPWPYTDWFIKTYGNGVMEELFALRNSMNKVTDDDLRLLLDERRCMLRGMK